MLSFFPRDVLDEILNLIKSVSEGSPTYSYKTTLKMAPKLSSFTPLCTAFLIHEQIMFLKFQWCIVIFTALTLTMSQPCLHNRVPIGVSGVDLHMEELVQEITYYNQGDGSYAFMVDENGKLQMRTVSYFSIAFCRNAVHLSCIPAFLAWLFSKKPSRYCHSPVTAEDICLKLRLVAYNQKRETIPEEVAILNLFLT